MLCIKLALRNRYRKFDLAGKKMVFHVICCFFRFKNCMWGLGLEGRFVSWTSSGGFFFKKGFLRGDLMGRRNIIILFFLLCGLQWGVAVGIANF